MSATLARILQFGIVGIAGFAVDGGAMMVLTQTLALSPLAVRPASFAMAVTVTWWLNRKFTFAYAKSNHALREWWRYVVSNAAGAALNLLVFYLAMLASPQLVHRPLLALAFASAAAMFFNYQMALRVVFRHKKKPPQAIASDDHC